MRNVAIVTATRAEYGISKNILKKIEKSKKLNLQLIVTGTHLSEKFGLTVKEIIQDGFKITKKINILIENKNKSRMSCEMAKLILELSQTFEHLKTDFLIIIGDRYEMLAVASVALTMNIPIAHISGGEITQGAIDEQVRHAITKLAHIHFPGCEEYAQNINRMGEEDWRIFNVGDPAIENIKNCKLLDKNELKKELGIEIDNQTLLVTYHPVTLELEYVENQIIDLIKALSKVNKKIILTYPNVDKGSEIIIKNIERFSKNNKNVYLFKSLGLEKYLSVMKYCGAVIGNSSSALIEAPYLKTAVLNIGNRQNGRLKANNIIDCSNKCEDIMKGINYILSSEFRNKVKLTQSIYGDGNTSEEIVKILENIKIDYKLLSKKLIWS